MAMVALKWAAILMAVVLLIVVLLSAFLHPFETLGTLLFFLFARVLTTHPVPCLAVLCIVSIALLLRSAGQAQAETDDDST
jgi:hypothetical protein